MDKISLSKATRLTSSNPVSIVCSLKEDGGTNLATVSWWTYLSFEPDMIGFAMAKTSYTGELVRNNGKLILATPGADICRQVMGCGMCSGRTVDKIKQFEVEMQDVPGSDIKIPLHSRVAIQCSMKEFVETGDHYFYICTVEQVFGNKEEEAVFAWKGFSQIAPAKQ